ncbi:hypothetical protein [Pelagimonas sp. KU-00592-HH]|uniref:hypothetical protein n=1 Tax=Pelagimonas sp. KU-00592-HH TaxID=3127651 RepID=UPI003341FF71
MVDRVSNDGPAEERSSEKSRIQLLEIALAEYVQSYGWTDNSRNALLGGREVRSNVAALGKGNL